MITVRRASLPAHLMLTWESQVEQYPETGEPGLGYFSGDVGETLPPVDCLLWRDDSGAVVGILNHYQVDYPPWEKAGNVNLWVHPDHQHQGIGTRLMDEAQRRWGPLNFDQQRYTPAGLAFITAWESR